MAQKKALQTIFEKYPFIVTLVMDPTGALMLAEKADQHAERTLQRGAALGRQVLQQVAHDYLAEVAEGEAPTDCLGWWKLHVKKYPHLAFVARCILSAQASSAATERLYSVGGVVVSRFRTRLARRKAHSSSSVSAHGRHQTACHGRGRLRNR